MSWFRAVHLVSLTFCLATVLSITGHGILRSLTIIGVLSLSPVVWCVCLEMLNLPNVIDAVVIIKCLSPTSFCLLSPKHSHPSLVSAALQNIHSLSLLSVYLYLHMCKACGCRGPLSSPALAAPWWFNLFLLNVTTLLDRCLRFYFAFCLMPFLFLYFSFNAFFCFK